MNWCYRIFAVFMAGSVVMGAVRVTAQTTSAVISPAAACKALANVDFSGVQDAPTQIVEAKLIEAKGVVPMYCLAKGYITSTVGIELQLPVANWNGKFLEIGCGGHCGAFFTPLCAGPLRKGYACIASDMGHTALTTQGAWAYNNLQAQVDWGYRAAHVTAIAGKAITEAYYSRTPARSYFLGCSTGGREGMVEAQRFPFDFDGIVAGAPIINSEGWPIDFLWAIKALAGPDGNPVLSSTDAMLLHDAVVAKCGADDGVKDGIISNPRACRFDPAVLQCKSAGQAACLTGSQTEVVRKMYAGPPASIVDRIYTEGATPGSELNWVSDFLSYWSTGQMVGEMYRYEGFWPAPGPRWKNSDFDFNRDYERMGMFASLANANNPDLRKFSALGHKLLSYFGWQDPSPPEVIDYYETVEKTMGGREATQDFFRLFMIPGMDHCSGGAGAFAIDYLSSLEAWVEQGKAPDKLIGAHINGLTWGEAFSLPFPLNSNTPVAFTRPVFPYPVRAKYKGSGDTNDAANFVPISPR